MIHEIPPQLAEGFWPMVEPLLANALRFHPHLSLSGLRHVLVTSMAELVILVENDRIIGAAVMESVKYPSKSVGNIVALGTQTGVWKTHGEAFTEALEQWCKRRGLSTLHMLGRAGWSRFVTRHGWKTQPSLIAWKELT